VEAFGRRRHLFLNYYSTRGTYAKLDEQKEAPYVQHQGMQRSIMRAVIHLQNLSPDASTEDSQNFTMIDQPERSTCSPMKM
jgi:hypothetical protein